MAASRLYFLLVAVPAPERGGEVKEGYGDGLRVGMSRLAVMIERHRCKAHDIPPLSFLASALPPEMQWYMNAQHWSKMS